jgi:hypothetical protein
LVGIGDHLQLIPSLIEEDGHALKSSEEIEVCPDVPGVGDVGGAGELPDDDEALVVDVKA